MCVCVCVCVCICVHVHVHVSAPMLCKRTTHTFLPYIIYAVRALVADNEVCLHHVQAHVCIYTHM